MLPDANGTCNVGSSGSNVGLTGGDGATYTRPLRGLRSTVYPMLRFVHAPGKRARCSEQIGRRWVAVVWPHCARYCVLAGSHRSSGHRSLGRFFFFLCETSTAAYSRASMLGHPRSVSRTGRLPSVQLSDRQDKE